MKQNYADWYQEWLKRLLSDTAREVWPCRNPLNHAAIILVNEGLLSELTEEEAKRFGAMEPISIDDVIDMHIALRDGDELLAD